MTCTVNNSFNAMYFNNSHHFILTLNGFDTETENENTNPASFESNAPQVEPLTLKELALAILSQFN